MSIKSNRKNQKNWSYRWKKILLKGSTQLIKRPAILWRSSKLFVSDSISRKRTKSSHNQSLSINRKKLTQFKDLKNRNNNWFNSYSKRSSNVFNQNLSWKAKCTSRNYLEETYLHLRIKIIRFKLRRNINRTLRLLQVQSIKSIWNRVSRIRVTVIIN